MDLKVLIKFSQNDAVNGRANGLFIVTFSYSFHALTHL